MLAAVIANVSGKTLRRTVSDKTFLPDYLKMEMENATIMAKSIEQQRAEFRAFTSRYRAAVSEAKRGRRAA